MGSYDVGAMSGKQIADLLEWADRHPGYVIGANAKTLRMIVENVPLLAPRCLKCNMIVDGVAYLFDRHGMLGPFSPTRIFP
jgi:hypothetical protein